MQTINDLLKWIFFSSKDPEQVSLTVKMVLLGVIPWAIQAIGLSCGLHIACVAVTGADLQGLASDGAQLVYLALSAVAVLGSIYGFVRKLLRSAGGVNAAFAAR